MSVITYKMEDQVAFIHLNRPEVYNSFNREMALALHARLNSCAEDDNIRCIVITGQGKAFSAGQDLNEAIEDNGISLERILSEHYNPLILKIQSLEKPIIAAVNGVAAGAGANMALACDIVIASKSASFIQAFSKIGLIPDSGGTYFLPRLIGWQKATALIFTGEKVSAEEAERMGLIYKYVEDDKLEEVVNALAFKLAKMPTLALGMAKRALYGSYTNDLSDQLELEKQLQVAAGNTDDYQEGVAAFLEKRKPKFVGR